MTDDSKFRLMKYGYDANGRMRKSAHTADLNNPGTAIYDGAGQRVATTLAALTRHLVIDIAGRVISEYENGLWKRDNIYQGGSLLASEETSASCYKTISQFVRDFYQGALYRQPNSTELTNWTNDLTNAKNQGPSQLLDRAKELGRTLFQSSEYTGLSRTNRTFVEDLYRGYLQRAPDEGGWNFWTTHTDQNGRESGRLAFAGSIEFQQNVNRLCTSLATWNVRFTMVDHQGSTRVVTNETGSVVARHDYLPFGEEIGVGTGLRTAGQGFGATDRIRNRYAMTERDDATGLEHTGWRKYDSFSGRWTSPDPLAGSIGDPQSFNRYAYVQNDPVNFVDPSGLNMAAPNCEWNPFTGIWGCEGGINLGEVTIIGGERDVSTSLFGDGSVFGRVIEVGGPGGGVGGDGDGGGVGGGGVGGNTGGNQQKPDKEPCPPVPAAPPNADLNANIRTSADSYRHAQEISPYPDSGDDAAARILGHISTFAVRVAPGGPWDYKQQDIPGGRYIAFGNFNYGAAGAAAGFTQGQLLRAAGFVQKWFGDAPGSGGSVNIMNALTGSGGQEPFQDQTTDQENIKLGIVYYERGCHTR